MNRIDPESAALRSIDTPALVVDGRALAANIERMAGAALAAGVRLRPHAKTHKCVQIARLQLNAGATGIACATLAEAEALADAGIRELLITSPVMSEAKFGRVAALNRKAPLAVVVDHLHQIEGLAGALRPGDPRLSVLVDCDIGQARTGVAAATDALALAQAISAVDRLDYAGIQGFAGHAQHIFDPVERQAAAQRAAAALEDIAKALANSGMPPRLITGSGTGTYGADAGRPYNELQVGSYVFMDAEYARVVDETGAGPSFAPSLFVLATVISANRPGQVTVDAGTKALAFYGVPPGHLIGAPEGASYRFAGDEHGVIAIPEGSAPPAPGSRILIGATHCDPTVNLHPRLHIVTEDEVEDWPVLGRHAN